MQWHRISPHSACVSVSPLFLLSSLSPLCASPVVPSVRRQWSPLCVASGPLCASSVVPSVPLQWSPLCLFSGPLCASPVVPSVRRQWSPLCLFSGPLCASSVVPSVRRQWSPLCLFSGPHLCLSSLPRDGTTSGLRSGKRSGCGTIPITSSCGGLTFMESPIEESSVEVLLSEGRDEDEDLMHIQDRPINAGCDLYRPLSDEPVPHSLPDLDARSERGHEEPRRLVCASRGEIVLYQPQHGAKGWVRVSSDGIVDRIGRSCGHGGSVGSGSRR
jgi:hypothetical protein